MSSDNLDFLSTLEQVIAERARSAPDSSYTARLLAEGRMRVAQKVGEEGVELALAAVDGSDDDVRNESADLLYHLLVLLRSRDIGLAEICAVLESRHR